MRQGSVCSPAYHSGGQVNVGEFFRTVLPDEGYLIAATPFQIPNTNQTAWWNFVVNDIPELQVKAKSWAGEKRNVFFALSSFTEREIVHPTRKDRNGNPYKEKRTQANVKFTRSLFLDLDVKPDGKHYRTRKEAGLALTEFCRAVGLPKPLVVSSGYGLHVYWPLTANATRAEWKPVALKLKAICIELDLLADHECTSDEARVLRVPGSINYKRGGEEPVRILIDAGATDLAVLDTTLSKYISDNDVSVEATRPATSLPVIPILPAGVKGNLGATNDPLVADALVYECPAMGMLVGSRGAKASYPLWLAGLSIARYCEDPEPVALAISDGHPGFNRNETLAKMSTLTTGPALCTSFWKHDNDTCQACPHWKRITSPSQVGRPYRETPPEPVKGREIPSPPPPYQRLVHADGSMHIVTKEENDEGETITHYVCDYDLYPSRIMEQQTEEDVSDERSVWIAHLPRMGAIEFKMPQSMLSDPRKLHAFLLSRGLHVSPKEIKAVQIYMTAYLKALAKAADRERMYERLGWHSKYQSFVMPHEIYHRDGTTTSHVPSKTLDAVTKGALHTAGSLQGWRDHMQFYQGPQYPSSRVMIYCGFGAPLLHMTTFKGVLIAASGDTGRGKTTVLEAVGSIYGDPTGMLVGGGKYGSTMNALFSNLGTMHSLPMLWDDTTERDPEEMREFMLHISTGRGKERMHGNVHDGKVVTWETIVLSSANTDDVHRIMSVGKDSDPHLMRFISIPFDVLDRSTEAKIVADAFKRGYRENYGHAGAIYLQHITEHYDEIKDTVLKYMERFDRKLNAPSEERHWSATWAVAYVGGSIAYNLGLIPFRPKDDLDYMCTHVEGMRLAYHQAASSATDILSEFLESHVPNMLILSPKQSSNVDNIVQKPSRELYIRSEIDTGKMFIARNAITDFCTEKRANFTRLQAELQVAHIITRVNCHKVLGADTPLASGQTRCWEIDRAVLAATKGKKS